MRTKNTFYNSVAGILYYSIVTILNIFNRKIIITCLGIEYLGINSLISDLLNLLSITELGIGAIIIYYLYKPLAEKDIQTIRAYLKVFKKCYLYIALFILLTGLFLIPFFPLIVKEFNQIPISFHFVYCISLIDSIVGYFFAHKRALLIADQQNYIVLLFDLLSQIFSQLLQIIILLLAKDYYLYLLVRILCRFTNHTMIHIIYLKKYPYLRESSSILLDSSLLVQIRQKIKGGACHRFASFIVLGSNSIILSNLLGLSSVGIYSNYMLIINTLNQLLDYIITASKAGVGQLLTQQDQKKNLQIFQQLFYLNAAFTNLATTGLFCMISVIIEFIFGKKFVVSDSCVLSMTLYFYFMGMRKIFHIFKESSGIFYEDRYIALSESFINVFACIIFVKAYGISGVFWGNILSFSVLYLYTYPVLVCKKILHISYFAYLQQMLTYGLILGISIITTKFSLYFVPSENILTQIICSFLLCFFIPNILFILFTRRKAEFPLLLERISNLSKKQL